MKKMILPAGVHCALFAALVGCVGGGLDVDGASENLWSSSSQAAPKYWPDGPISVCFAPGGSMTSTTTIYRDLKTAAVAALATGYGPNDWSVDLVVRGDCVSSNPKGWIRATIADIGNAAQSEVGYQGRQEVTDINFSTSYTLGSDWDTVVLHEFAHALGFDHELRRPDSGIRFEDTTKTCDPGLSTVGNDGVTAWEGTRLTDNDPNSIMNGTYCHWNPVLTDLDRLGMSIVYPSTYEHPIALVGGSAFRTLDGFVLRTDDAGYFTTDWSARGAMADVYASADESVVWLWEPDGAPASERRGIELEASELAPGAGWLGGDYEDFRGRQHLSVPARVAVDDGLHTAILLAAI